MILSKNWLFLPDYAEAYMLKMQSIYSASLYFISIHGMWESMPWHERPSLKHNLLIDASCTIAIM